MNRYAYMLGCRDALRKLGGFRVAVTDEQTPQTESWPVAEGARQALSVNSIWENHDKRKQLFTEPPWPD